MATLYRTYRPQMFSDLVGQDHIRTTLQAALAQGRVGHAYLFAGPRGTGKTTVARLLAKAVNCLRVPEIRNQKLEINVDTPSADAKSPISDLQSLSEPCNECQLCLDITDGRALDIIEIDAASNRGIDEMRELRDKIKFAPSLARKKVFIIDEVHMLTKEAFNALLKTLEEPPAHALFVLATTEIHKVPVTISSRCQVFLFKKAKHTDLISRMATVAEKEQLAYEPAALEFLAGLAGGSYRDAISLLDQVSSLDGATLTVELVQRVLGLATETRLLELVETMASGGAENALNALHVIEADGTDLDQLAAQLIEVGRVLLHTKLGTTLATQLISEEQKDRWQQLAAVWTQAELLGFIQAFVTARAQMKISPVAVLPLEVAIVGFSRDQRLAISDQKRNPDDTQHPTPAGQILQEEEITIEVENLESLAELDEAGQSIDGQLVVVESPLNPQISDLQSLPADAAPQALQAEPISTYDGNAAVHWQTLLERLRGSNANLLGLLQQAEFVGLDGNTFVIRVPFQFTADRLADRKHKKVIEDILTELFTSPMALQCQIGSGTRVATIPYEGNVSIELTDAAEIFGLEEPN